MSALCENLVLNPAHLALNWRIHLFANKISRYTRIQKMCLFSGLSYVAGVIFVKRDVSTSNAKHMDYIACEYFFYNFATTIVIY